MIKPILVALVVGGAFWMLKDPGLYPEEIVMNALIPNGGETFVQGQPNTISWKGGTDIVAVGLAKPEATNDTDPSSLGYIIGWINDRQEGAHDANSSYQWDALRVCRLEFSLIPETECKRIQPGKYKIIVWSENANKSMYIATGRGAHYKYPPKADRGNWDVSDQPFTIK